MNAFYKYSHDTPPGTKIKIKGRVECPNGFMLLTKSSVEVLGGMVEGLLKKWSSTKASKILTIIHAHADCYRGNYLHANAVCVCVCVLNRLFVCCYFVIF